MDPYAEMRVLRARRGWSQRQLGIELEVATVTIARWEKPYGLDAIPPRHLLKLSRLMGVTADDLAEAITNYNHKRKGASDAVHS